MELNSNSNDSEIAVESTDENKIERNNIEVAHKSSENLVCSKNRAVTIASREQQVIGTAEKVEQ